jgi:antitoxin HigA-1
MGRPMSRSSTTTEDEVEEGKLPPVHPGEFLREDFMVPLDLSAGELAGDCGLDPATVEAIAQARAPVTAEVALRLARYFGTSAELWMGMQMQFDIESAEDRLENEIARINPRPQAAE